MAFSLVHILLFSVAATLGALLRLVSVIFLPAPWGTFAVNLAGSFLIGFCFIYFAELSEQSKIIVGVAFLGALTTFSAFSLDNVRLFNEGLYREMALYFILTNFLCLVGCYGGWAIAKTLVSKV